MKTELNQARSKPDTVDQPVRTVHTFVHIINSTQYFLQTIITLCAAFFKANKDWCTFQMWPGQVEVRGWKYDRLF